MGAALGDEIGKDKGNDLGASELGAALGDELGTDEGDALGASETKMNKNRGKGEVWGRREDEEGKIDGEEGDEEKTEETVLWVNSGQNDYLLLMVGSSFAHGCLYFSIAQISTQSKGTIHFTQVEERSLIAKALHRPLTSLAQHSRADHLDE